MYQKQVRKLIDMVIKATPVQNKTDNFIVFWTLPYDVRSACIHGLAYQKARELHPVEHCDIYIQLACTLTTVCTTQPRCPSPCYSTQSESM